MRRIAGARGGFGRNSSHVMLTWTGEVGVYISLIINTIFDSKRQQTTTVDNKRLFNGLVLTNYFSLRRKSN